MSVDNTNGMDWKRERVRHNTRSAAQSCGSVHTAIVRYPCLAVLPQHFASEFLSLICELMLAVTYSLFINDLFCRLKGYSQYSQK